MGRAGAGGGGGGHSGGGHSSGRSSGGHHVSGGSSGRRAGSGGSSQNSYGGGSFGGPSYGGVFSVEAFIHAHQDEVLFLSVVEVGLTPLYHSLYLLLFLLLHSVVFRRQIHLQRKVCQKVHKTENSWNLA